MSADNVSDNSESRVSREVLYLIIILYAPLFAIIWIASVFRGNTLLSDNDVRGIIGLAIMYSALAAAELYGFARETIPSVRKWADKRILLHRALQLFAVAFAVCYGCVVALSSTRLFGSIRYEPLFEWSLLLSTLIVFAHTLLHYTRNCAVVCGEK